MKYSNPKLVLFSDAQETECRNTTAASGPFYCPTDQKVYMDLAFFEELKTRFGAQGGDFATAYIIAHEIGHHIQTVLGTSARITQIQEGKSQAEANKLSVALEPQADFSAGVWTHCNQKINNFLEEGDIDEALSKHTLLVMMQFKLKFKDMLFRNLLQTELQHNVKLSL